MKLMQVHIVYMGALPAGDYSPSSHHFRFSGFFMKLLRAGNVFVSVTLILSAQVFSFLCFICCYQLPSLSIYSSSKDVLVRSYQRSFNGFAVKLTDQEQKRISNYYDWFAQQKMNSHVMIGLQGWSCDSVSK